MDVLHLELLAAASAPQGGVVVEGLGLSRPEGVSICGLAPGPAGHLR